MKRIIKVNFVILCTIVLILQMAGCQQQKTYVVNFDEQNGVGVTTLNVKEGEKISKPDNPIKNGFTFIEWELDGKKYDFETPVTKDITLIAKYKVNKETEVVLLAIDLDNGQQLQKMEFKKGDKIEKLLEPKKEGFIFDGWYVNNERIVFPFELKENKKITAKWQKRVDDKKPSIDNAVNTNEENEKQDSTDAKPSSKPSSKDYGPTIKKYSGRWFLQGYKDVCIDVKRIDYCDGYEMSIVATNFAFPPNGLNSIYDTYALYPGKGYEYVDYTITWCSNINIVNYKWEDDLKKYEVSLKENSIDIGGYKFVRQQGSTDMYYDTCYKQALGRWYSTTDKDSEIEVKTFSKADRLCDSDYFEIVCKNFDLKTFETNCSYSELGKASAKSDWEKYGISVNNDVLTVTNNLGTRTFVRTKPDIKTKVTGVAFASGIDGATIQMGINKDAQFEVLVFPEDAYDKTVKWESSNPSVASINQNGLVTLVSEGVTILKVTTNDGGFQDTFVLTVEKLPTIEEPNDNTIRVDNVYLNTSYMTMNISEVQHLIATISPYNATNRNIAWESSDVNVATVDNNGKVIAIGEGVTTITVTTKDGNYKSSCTVEVIGKSLRADAGVGVRYTCDENGCGNFVYAYINVSGGSGAYTYSYDIYKDGTYIGSYSLPEVNLPYELGTYKIDYTVTDNQGNTISGSSTTTIS